MSEGTGVSDQHFKQFWEVAQNKGMPISLNNFQGMALATLKVTLEQLVPKANIRIKAPTKRSIFARKTKIRTPRNRYVLIPKPDIHIRRKVYLRSAVKTFLANVHKNEIFGTLNDGPTVFGQMIQIVTYYLKCQI